MPFGAPPPPGVSGRGGSTALRAVLGIFGVLLLIGGGGLAAHAYSNSRQEIDNTAYGEDLWRNEAADTVLPGTIGARSGDYDGALTTPRNAQWRRLGLSPDTSCTAGLSGKTRTTAAKLGCEAVLRATYVDPTGNQLATVVIVVLPIAGGDASTSAKNQLGAFFTGRDGVEGAVNVLPVKGTLAAHWTNDARNAAALEPVSGDSMHYAIGVTLGAVDGLWAGHLPGTFGEADSDGRADRNAWQGDAEGLVSTFNTHLSDLQLSGVK
ncbi:hypothetical protein ACFYPA_28850 [Streptomyces sp. NPDC005775]|uniref:hypothetical protein n=1 Tax=unclassified Streptomyces TaxID=2593676 RepID=UPI0033F63869